jgi:dGTPase
MYRAPSVIVERKRVTAMVNALFPLFMEKPELLPEEWRQEIALAQSDTDLARIVLDYVAGMTDRFAIQEYERLIEGK